MSLWSWKTKYSNLHLFQTFESLFLLESWKCGPFLWDKKCLWQKERETLQRQCYHMAFKQRRKKIPNKPTPHSSNKRPVIDSWPEAGEECLATAAGPLGSSDDTQSRRAEDSPWSMMCKAEKPDLNKARDSAIKKESQHAGDTERSLRAFTSHQAPQVWWKLFQTLKHLLLLGTGRLSPNRWPWLQPQLMGQTVREAQHKRYSHEKKSKLKRPSVMKAHSSMQSLLPTLVLGVQLPKSLTADPKARWCLLKGRTNLKIEGEMEIGG